MGETEALVSISSGVLKGRQLTTDTGFDYCSFQGIPYAKPPLGELRFKAPQPLEPWKGIKDATKEGNQAWQFNFITQILGGDEDCLFANVYTPRLPAAGGKDLPVMVWIHGGGFVMGSGDSDSQGPDYLVAEDVVLVTFNYRLGPFGFLSTDNDKIPGNAGLKDQVALLRWVRDNISAFGGNPNNVTIFGESAGGASVHYLLLSASTKGLFHRAISQSGSALNPWAVQRNPAGNVILLCNAMGNPTKDQDEALRFLKLAPAKDIIEGHQKLPTGIYTIGLPMAIVPSIEKEYIGEESFISEDTIKIIAEGKFHQVPYITGFNSEEGLVSCFGIAAKTTTYDQINSTRGFLVPEDITDEMQEDAWRRIKKYYFNDQPVSDKNLIDYAHVKSDTEFVYGINKTVELHSKISTSPVYYYRYAYEGLGMVKTMFQITLPGACHADELVFLFKLGGLNVKFEKGSEIETNHRRLIKLWTNFAKTGNPTPTTDDLIPVLWQPVTKDKLKYLDINVDLAMEANPQVGRIAFWDEMYRKETQ